MTREDLSIVASQNLRKTYFALGRSTPGSKIVSEPGFEACLGNFEHPICNFATGLSLDPWVAHRLAEIAVAKRVFTVYSLPGDLPVDPVVRDELLTRTGFRKSYSLRQMVAEPGQIGQGTPLHKAESLAERREIATFMAGIFFGRHSATFRRRVAEATLAATELDLYSVKVRDELIAAVMVVEDERITGLFNLCVKVSYQGKGWGAAIVNEVLKMAFEAGKPVTLQCDEVLSAWYEHLGFRRSGLVDVYSLPEERRVAIMS